MGKFNISQCDFVFRIPYLSAEDESTVTFFETTTFDSDFICEQCPDFPLGLTLSKDKDFRFAELHELVMSYYLAKATKETANDKAYFFAHAGNVI